jgi:two-component system response regulator FixJ
VTTHALVHVVDDDEAVHASLEFLLASAGLEARTYSSATAFLEVLPSVQDGCVVTDIRMPEMDGLQLLTLIKQAKPDLPVIMITGHGDVSLAVDAMKTGAAEFLEKPFEGQALLSAVFSALDAAARERERDAESVAVKERLTSLSPRERQVLDGIVAGQSNKTIGVKLGISPRTVEIYRANVMEKMEARTLSDLIQKTIIARGQKTTN